MEDTAEGRLASSPSKQAPYQRERFVKQRAQLREFSCSAMSHLLSANIDVGLGHSISMGYHEDESVRLAFVEVLTKVLHQGTEFDTLAETVLSDRYTKLVQLVVEPNLALVEAMGETANSDTLDLLAAVLQRVFDAHSALLPFFFRAAEWEVLACKSAQTLFRRNSLATKLASSCAKLYGQEYLINLLTPVLEAMLAKPERNYEIDPVKLKLGESLDDNIANLHVLAAHIFDSVLASSKFVPTAFCMLCFALRRATQARYPDAALSPVGGFFFLRFVSPALVSPAAHGFDEMEGLPPRVHRGLLLASKVVQAVANMAPFSGVKEVYMQVMNAFVLERMPPCVDFLDAISAPPTKVEPTFAAECSRYGVVLHSAMGNGKTSMLRTRSLREVSRSAMDSESLVVPENDLFVLQRLLFDNLERIGRELTATGIKNRETTVAMSTLLENLTTVLAQLGEPPKTSSAQRRMSHSLGSHTKDSKFEEFMTRYRAHHQKIVTEIGSKQIFFQNGVSKAKNPVFYFIARRFGLAECDADQVIYSVLNILKPHLRAPFELVLDMTEFSRENEPPMVVISRFLDVLPSHLLENLVQIYVYNISTWFRAFSKRIQRLVVSSKLHKKMLFVTLEQLQAALPECHLPAHTLRLRETTHEFNNVMRILVNKKAQPVTVLLGPAAIVVVSNEKYKLFGLSAATSDVFDVSRIKEIMDAPAEHVALSYDHGSEVLQLISPDAAVLLRIIQETHARHLLSEPANTTARKVMRPADVPGTLLNMALLNLGSLDASLRLAAYNFLSALTTTFDFNIGGELMEAAGLAIPKNNSNFIIRISECLAENEPRLSLEFLDECIAGLSSSSSEQKHLCLEYMAPWLPNVKDFASGSPEKMINIIRGLVDITIKEQELYTSLQANVWYTLGRVDDLVVLVMDEFLKVALDAGPGSSPATILSDAAVTLAAANVGPVSRTVVGRLLLLLERTGQEHPVQQLEQHPLFRDIQVLSRFLLMLSFNNRLDVKLQLPDVLHIVTMLLACGPPMLRASMLSVTINVVQSLGTTMELSDDGLHLLRLRLAEMLQPKFRHQFGVSSTKSQSVFGDATSVPSGQMLDSVNLSSLEAIVDTMLEILLACAPPTSAWHERWVEVATSTAFARNPALQPRAFVSLGVMTHELPAELLPRILATLQQALESWDIVLIDSIAMCLTRVLHAFLKGGSYHVALFWVAMAILEVGEEEVFSSALAVLETTLRTLDQHDAFLGRGIGPVMMSAHAAVAELCGELDRESGISFTNNFSFAVAGVLLKGLNHCSAPTIARTIRVLMAFLNVERSARGVELHPDMIGYVAALFPIMDELRQSLANEHGSYGQLLSGDMLATEVDVALLLVTVCARLEYTKHQTETRFIYDFLAHACQSYPHVFSVVSSMLSSKLHSVITRPQDPSVIHSCHSILRTLVPVALNPAQPSVPANVLEAVGFGGLAQTGGFRQSSTSTQLMAKICGQLLAKLLALAAEPHGEHFLSVCSTPSQLQVTLHRDLLRSDTLGPSATAQATLSISLSDLDQAEGENEGDHPEEQEGEQSATVVSPLGRIETSHVTLMANGEPISPILGRRATLLLQRADSGPEEAEA